MNLHEITSVLGAYLTFSGRNPGELLVIMRDLAAAAPGTQTLMGTLAPDKDDTFSLTVQLCDAGDPVMAERALTPFRPSRLLSSNTVKVQPYLALEQQVPMEIPPMRRETRGGFLPELSDTAIAIIAHAVAKAPDRDGDIAFLHLHGAVTAVLPHATAFPLRHRGFAHNIAARWPAASGPERASAWVRATAAALAPFGDGAYVNVMGREDDAAVRAAYAGNFARLAATKATYDPSNLFSINQNIKPAAMS